MWQGYSTNTTNEYILKYFAKKYGYEPKEIKRTPSCVLAGPLKEKENE